MRFLDPSIVYAIAENNRRMEADWSSWLEALGIDPAVSLWEGSPRAFPGVRRHAGSGASWRSAVDEIADGLIEEVVEGRNGMAAGHAVPPVRPVDPELGIGHALDLDLAVLGWKIEVA